MVAMVYLQAQLFFFEDDKISKSLTKLIDRSNCVLI